MKNITAGIIGAVVAFAAMGTVGVIQHYRAAYQQTGPGGDPFQMQQLSSNENARYAALPAAGAARAFFEACGRGDWEEVEKFCAGIAPFDEKFKEGMTGVTVVSLGDPFTRPGFAATFVPYEIRFKTGETKKFNLAIRRDNPQGRWMFDGGL